MRLLGQGRISLILWPKSAILAIDMQGNTYIFFGMPGSGKGTQIELLINYLKEKTGKDTVSRSLGAEFRKLVDSGNFTGKLLKDTMEGGEILPDFLPNAFFLNTLTNDLSDEKHLIADAYPRTIPQAKNLEDILLFYRRSDVKMVFISLNFEEAQKRNILRGRTDDTEDSLRVRFEEYKNKTIPGMNYLKDRGLYEFCEIDGAQSIEDVHKEIVEKLKI